MTWRAASLLVGLALVVGCSNVRESNYNPMNWFGRSTEEQVRIAQEELAADDPRPLIAQVTELTIERTPGGAIIRAVGLPPSIGYYDADLVPANREKPIDGVMEYRFRVVPPFGVTQIGSEAARRIEVARFVTDQTLRGVTSIRVVSASNALIARR